MNATFCKFEVYTHSWSEQVHDYFLLFVTMLVNLHLEGNFMTGDVSMSFCDMKVFDLNVFVTDCGHPDVTCDCCTRCCNITDC